MRKMAGIFATALPLALTLGFSAAVGAADGVFEVNAVSIDDLKAVYATVRSKDLTEARVRTPGTIVSLKIDKGDSVQQGQLLALVGDPKIALRIKAADARIVAGESRLETAKTELDRSQSLLAKGVAPQARVDQAQTAYDVALNDLKAARADRSVIETESEEGQVLAPTSGRVLRVPVTEGTVVLAGESIATIAANGYLLRIQVPERFARFMKVGDAVRIGARGLGADEKPLVQGHIVKVYPELTDGQVVADSEVPGLGDYFIGERVLTWISAGTRQTFLVPPAFVFKRFGLDYVRLKEDGSGVSDVVVQAGRQVKNASGEDRIEILSGLKSGDRLVQP